MYTKQFEIRWNDLDANMHLGNSAYIEFMSHTRMSFLTERGIGLDVMNGFGIGPIVLYEHIYYFREILLGKPIKVSLEVSGYSVDGRFIRFHHNFFDHQGKNLAHAEMLFSWIDINTRKLGRVPEQLLEKVKQFPKTDEFKLLTVEDTRKFGKSPKNLK